MQNEILLLPIVAALFLLLTVSGCSGTLGTKSIKTTTDIPAEMFECEAPGVRPKGETIMESDVARYINSLEFSNKDCRTRLKEVQILIKCSNDKSCKVDHLISLLALANDKPRR